MRPPSTRAIAAAVELINRNICDGSDAGACTPVKRSSQNSPLALAYTGDHPTRSQYYGYNYLYIPPILR